MPRQNLTANACTVCRRKRTKCDGREPCRRCVSRGEECLYEDKMWRTKDHLRSEIERLRKELYQCQGLIKALTLTDSRNDDWRSIQSRMHRGEPPERIAAWINSQRIPTSPAPTDAPPDHKEQQTVSPRSSYVSTTSLETSSSAAIGSGQDAVAARDFASSHLSSPEDTYAAVSPTTVSPTTVSPAATDGSSDSLGHTYSYPTPAATQDAATGPRTLRSWTKVTQDTGLLHRLLYHYFDNCYPTFSFICKERFITDIGEGTGMYCSAALVNAVLGLASQSYRNSAKGPHSCLSRRFLAQANELVATDKAQPSITDIQATGLLALAEANVGNDEVTLELATDCVRKTVLLKMDMDAGAVQTGSVHREDLATTFCGAFSLVRIYRILIGRMSCQTGPLFMRLTPEDDDKTFDSPAARVERGVALQQYFFSQLDYCPEVSRFIYTATEIAHTFCSYHYDDGVTPADLVPAYEKCLQAWKRFNQWLTEGSECNKDIIFAQIWYNYIMMVLFSTLIDSSVDLRDGITPKAVVLQASETIIFLTDLYQDQYGFLAVHPLLPHMVFAATLVQLRRPSDEMSVQREAPEPGGERRRAPSTSARWAPPTSARGRVDSLDMSPRATPWPRTGSEGPAFTRLVYPSWQQHLTASTMHSVNHLDHTGDELSWQPRQASELAADGLLHLSKMAVNYPKAAELAQLLRARCANRPSGPAMVPTETPGVWTPGWGAVAWQPSNGIGAGFGGLGVDSLQGFSALTGIVPRAASGYMSGQGLGYEGGGQDSGGTSRDMYGGLYIYPHSLPQVGGFDAYPDGVGFQSFASGMKREEEDVGELT